MEGNTPHHLRKLRTLVSKFQALVASQAPSAGAGARADEKGVATEKSDEGGDVLVVLNGGVQSAVPPHRLRHLLLTLTDQHTKRKTSMMKKIPSSSPSSSSCASDALHDHLSSSSSSYDIQVHFSQRHTFAFATIFEPLVASSSSEVRGDSSSSSSSSSSSCSSSSSLLNHLKAALKAYGVTYAGGNHDDSDCTSAAPFFLMPKTSLISWQASSTPIPSSSSSDPAAGQLVTPLYCCWADRKALRLLIQPSDAVLMPLGPALWNRQTYLRRRCESKIGDDGGEAEEENDEEDPSARALRSEMVLGTSSLPCALVPVASVPGLYIATNFISRAEHDALFRLLAMTGAASGSCAEEQQEGDISSTATSSSSLFPWVPLAKRHVIHFNRQFLYGSNTVGPVGDGALPMPLWASRLQQRLSGQQVPLFDDDDDRESASRVLLPPLWPMPLGPGSINFDQITVNKYHMFDVPINCSAAEVETEKKEEEGDDDGKKPKKRQKVISSGIAPHVDAHSPFGDYVLSLSVGSYSIITFRPFVAAGVTAASPVHFLLPPRSLVIMSGLARYAFTHGIQERSSDILCDLFPPVERSLRFSVTLREARVGPPHSREACICPGLCDAPKAQ